MAPIAIKPITANIGLANISLPSHRIAWPAAPITFVTRPNTEANLSWRMPALTRTTAIGPRIDASASDTTPAAVAATANTAATVNIAAVSRGCRLTNPSSPEARFPSQSDSVLSTGETVSPMLAIALVKDPVAASHLLPRVLRDASTRSRRVAWFSSLATVSR
ncbi:Uncharacterised protein [Klebsiella variicola]|nr:Uncharacterised protein [Klebsiella variicola]SYT86656.1 Uncharacterised protein [Klebsiella pneumoniae]